MSDVFSAAGQVAGAAIQASAMRDATNAQIDALERQREFVYNQLNPSVVGGAAKNADIARAGDRLALQNQIDPELLKQRYAAQDAITKSLGNLGEGGAGANVASVAERELLSSGPKFQEARNRLIDEALKELDAGATLPPDVQAEIVQTGLERAGNTSGAAGPNGFGQHILRTLVGKAGLDLQAKRQEKAAALTQSAQDLESKRQAVLQTLFPNLANSQLNRLQGQQSVLAQANQMVPEAGLGGSDIANIWLARVGATNQLAQSSADAAARGAMGQGAIWGNALGGATRAIAPSVGNAWSSMAKANPSSYNGYGADYDSVDGLGYL